MKKLILLLTMISLIQCPVIAAADHPPIFQIGVEQDTEVKAMPPKDVLVSADIEKALKSYLTNSLDFPDDCIITFGFYYNKKGVIGDIITTAVKENSKDDNYQTMYGDFMPEPAAGRVYAGKYSYLKNGASQSNYSMMPAKDAMCGEFLVKLYDAIKRLGKTHTKGISVKANDGSYKHVQGLYSNSVLYIYLAK